MLLFLSSPDGGGAFAQVVAELQDPLVEGQRDEVAPAVRLLAVVEDHPVGVVGHEGDDDADFLPSDRDDGSEFNAGEKAQPIAGPGGRDLT